MLIGWEFTVTVKLQLVLLPQVSLAVVNTVVVPIGNVLPLGGLATTVGVLQPPLAVTVKNTVAPVELVAVTVMLDEQVSAIGEVVGVLVFKFGAQVTYCGSTGCSGIWEMLCWNWVTSLGMF